MYQTNNTVIVFLNYMQTKSNCLLTYFNVCAFAVQSRRLYIQRYVKCLTDNGVVDDIGGGVRLQLCNSGQSSLGDIHDKRHRTGHQMG